MAMFLSYFVTK